MGYFQIAKIVAKLTNKHKNEISCTFIIETIIYY